MPHFDRTGIKIEFRFFPQFSFGIPWRTSKVRPGKRGVFSPERATPLLPLVLLMTVSRNGKQESCTGQQFANAEPHRLFNVGIWHFLQHFLLSSARLLILIGCVKSALDCRSVTRWDRRRQYVGLRTESECKTLS
jgi:hypothetical protein